MQSRAKLKTKLAKIIDLKQVTKGTVGKNGYGKFSYRGILGGVYEGNYKDGKRHGKGKIRFK